MLPSKSLARIVAEGILIDNQKVELQFNKQEYIIEAYSKQVKLLLENEALPLGVPKWYALVPITRAPKDTATYVEGSKEQTPYLSFKLLGTVNHLELLDTKLFNKIIAIGTVRYISGKYGFFIVRTFRHGYPQTVKIHGCVESSNNTCIGRPIKVVASIEGNRLVLVEYEFLDGKEKESIQQMD
jgi:hypothetical protein